MENWPLRVTAANRIWNLPNIKHKIQRQSQLVRWEIMWFLVVNSGYGYIRVQNSIAVR